MDSILHKCLEMIEGEGLPEGDFLKACNALKKAFNEKDDTTYKTVPITFHCEFSNDDDKCEILVQSATFKRRQESYPWELHRFHLLINIRTDNRDSQTLVLPHQSLCDTVQCLTYSIRPKEVCFFTKMGGFSKTVKNFLQSSWSEYRIKEEITGEEDDDYLCNFDAELFYHWIGMRVSALAHSEADDVRLNGF